MIGSSINHNTVNTESSEQEVYKNINLKDNTNNNLIRVPDIMRTSEKTKNKFTEDSEKN